jgi:hypothetical protein
MEAWHGSTVMQNEYRESVSEIETGRIREYKIRNGGDFLTYSAFLDSLSQSYEFRSYFNDLLASCDYPAFRWETPGTTIDTMKKEFSFVIINSPGLERPLDKESFRDFLMPYDDIAVFPGLRKDAIMIIPTLPKHSHGYGHLASFVRNAPAEIRSKLWQTVGAEMNNKVSDTPIWLSTAGGGVSWLHVRIDSRPKYYSYSKYKHA